MRPNWSNLLLAGLLSASLAGLIIALRTGQPLPPRSGRVAGHSMAPHLLGPHRQIRCPRCQFDFPIAVTPHTQQHANPSTFHCANCRSPLSFSTPPASTPPAGHPPSDPSSGSLTFRAVQSPTLPGDRVELVRRGAEDRPIERWELVVVAGPAPEPGWVVKRVLALPGEQLTLRQGDVWIDGHRAARTWDQVRQTLVLVHDDAYRAPGDPPWRPAAHPTGWTTLPHGYAWQPLGTDTQQSNPDELQWSLGPVTDDLAYNVQYRGRLFEVLDGALTVRVRASHLDASWEARWVSSSEDWRAIIDCRTGQWSIRCNDRPVAQQTLDDATEGRFAWYVCDGRQAWFWNDRLVWEGTVQEGQPTQIPWRLIGLNGHVIVDELRVWRDLYYTPLESWDSERSYPVGPDELFLAGDNVALSWDSRYPSFRAGPRNVIARPSKPATQ